MLVDREAGEDGPEWPSSEGMRRRTKRDDGWKPPRSERTPYYLKMPTNNTLGLVTAALGDKVCDSFRGELDKLRN